MQDIADRISALEQNAKIAWGEGDTTLYQRLQDKIHELSSRARDMGATEQSHPGLFQWFGKAKKRENEE